MTDKREEIDLTSTNIPELAGLTPRNLGSKDYDTTAYRSARLKIK